MAAASAAVVSLRDIALAADENTATRHILQKEGAGQRRRRAATKAKMERETAVPSPDAVRVA